MRKSLVAAAAVGIGGAVVAQRRLARLIDSFATNPDTCDGQPTLLGESQERWMEASDGARLRALDFGPAEGPTVVLVHCWTGNVGYWAPVITRLVERGHRVVATEQRGHGGSARGTAPYTTATLAADLRGWFEELDLDGAVLGGHSMGGVAAMALAVDHPELVAARVRALVLVATLASPIEDPRFPVSIDLSKFLGVADRVMRPADVGLLGMLGVFGTRPARSQLEAARAGFFSTDPISRRDAARMLYTFDLRPDLPGIAVPTTVLAGSHDQLTFLHMNEKIAELIPGATLEVLHGLGHMLPWEAPDRVASAIGQAAAAPATPV